MADFVFETFCHIDFHKQDKTYDKRHSKFKNFMLLSAQNSSSIRGNQVHKIYMVHLLDFGMVVRIHLFMQRSSLFVFETGVFSSSHRNSMNMSMVLYFTIQRHKQEPFAQPAKLRLYSSQQDEERRKEILGKRK